MVVGKPSMQWLHLFRVCRRLEPFKSFGLGCTRFARGWQVQVLSVCTCLYNLDE